MRPIKRQQVLPVSLVILIVSAASLFEAQEPRKPIKIDATLLQGIQNFRDIGGYKTADGHTIRYNMVYRSAMLHDMTLADNANPVVIPFSSLVFGRSIPTSFGHPRYGSGPASHA